MNYKITDTDSSLAQKMSTQEGKSIIIDLQTKIEDEELQLDKFKEGINRCNSEIAKVEPVLRDATATFKKLVNHKPRTQDIKDQINEVRAIKEDYKAKKLAFEENYLVWNISGYITLISIDIKTMQKGLYSATTEWDKRFFARQSYLIMYDAPQKIINQIEKLLQRAGYRPFFTILEEAKTRLKEFVKKYGTYIGDVRNNTAGHKDEKVIKQLNVIENIEWSNTIEITNEFEEQINDLGALLKLLIDAGLENIATAFSE